MSQENLHREIVVEAPMTPSAIDKQFPRRFPSVEQRPSVKNLTRFVANGETYTILNFKDGQDGQRIYILGDGTTTVDHNANIKRTGGAAGVLTADLIYTFTRIVKTGIDNGVWYEG